MKDNFFKVFNQATDHNKWSKHIEYASLMEGIEAKDELITALEFLEAELGKGFLKNSNDDHPIRQKISNKSDWQAQELIQFAATLHTLKGTKSNYPKVLKKLLALEKSKMEGVPFLEIAESYLKENFTVSFPDEPNTGKSPDIEISNPNNNDTFFIEVSVIKESEDRKMKSKNYHFLTNQFQFIPPFCIYTGKQKTPFAREDYPEIQKIIADLKEKVEEQQTFVSYSDERFEITLAPNDKVEEMEKFCELNGTRRNDVTSLPLDFDETDRIINNNKIKDKASQIPQHGNGLIYFPINPLFFMTTDIGNAVIRLKEYIAKFPNLLGIVFYSKILDQREEEYQEMENHVFSRKMLKSILCCELLFIYNHNCQLKIQEETLQKIYSTFK